MEHFYGPGSNNRNFVTYLVRSCLSNKPVLPLTKGEQTRDFLYVDDAVEAFLFIAGSIHTFDTNYLAIELGSGETASIRELAERVRSMTGATTVFRFGDIPYRLNEPMTTKIDTTFIKELGWQPRVSLEEGLAKTIAWERNWLEEAERNTP
jgi:nucleoside-diphosphate-sugar epimerase